MATNFRTDYLSRAIPDLLLEFGETVTYVGRGSPREITAIIVRSPLTGLEVPDGVAPWAIMRVAPDRDLETHGGIDEDELRIGGVNGDSIIYEVNVGDAVPIEQPIHSRIHNSGGFIEFEVR